MIWENDAVVKLPMVLDDAHGGSYTSPLEKLRQLVEYEQSLVDKAEKNLKRAIRRRDTIRFSTRNGFVSFAEAKAMIEKGES